MTPDTDGPCAAPDAVRIRRATRNDLGTLVAFNRAMAQETEGKALDPTTVAAGVAEALSDPARSRYFIAERDGRIVGQTMVTTEWSDWRNGFFWWIQSVYVERACRRRGVFRSLYQHIREVARHTDGVCGLRLYVHHENRRAMNVYSELGMQRTDYLLYEDEWPASTEE